MGRAAARGAGPERAGRRALHWGGPDGRARSGGPGGEGRILDLRHGTAGPWAAAPAGPLRYAAGDLLVVSGLPGSGKSTLIKRAFASPGAALSAGAVRGASPETGPVPFTGRRDRAPREPYARGASGVKPMSFAGAEGQARDVRRVGVRRVDSQDTRERWEGLMPRSVPYGLYRPLVRIAHYARLYRALRSGDSVVVHDCGALSWVRRWLAREAGRRGRSLHLLLLDVPPETALEGQALRGRGVSGYAFGRHRRAMARLIANAERGRLPRGCGSGVLLDRRGASALSGIRFG